MEKNKNNTHSFHSFNTLKKFLGSPGQGMAWHHIVEQSQVGRRANFAPKRIHNTYNIVSIPSGRNSIHTKISSYYSSKQSFTNGMIVRDWLAARNFEFQFLFGKTVLEQYGNLIATNTGYEFKSN